MSTRDPRQTYLNRRRPIRRTPMWVAVTGFLVVVGALAVMARTTPPQPANNAIAAVVPSQPESRDVQAPLATRPTEQPVASPVTKPAVSAEPQPTVAGGAEADFESLTELIQNETAGPWEDVDGSGGTISDTGEMAGIHVDPNGLLTRVARIDTTGRLEQLSQVVSSASNNANLAHRSRLRLVSLSRLEQEVARRLDAGEPLPADIRHLAGLQQVRFVFTYPETGDIVIGGPAEGFKVSKTGTAIGAPSGHPVLQLDDLVTVLRAFTAEGGGVIGCSIAPRPEGLKQLNDLEYSRADIRFATRLGESLPRPQPLDSIQQVVSLSGGTGMGSTDVGDVSWVVPTAGFSTACWVPGTPGHSWQAVACGAQPIARKGMNLAARVLAANAWDLYTQPERIAAAREELQQKLTGRAYQSLMLPGQKPPLDYRNAPR